MAKQRGGLDGLLPKVVPEAGKRATATKTTVTFDEEDQEHVDRLQALLRGKRVSVYGRPFYAGWGLTEDQLDFPRRGRAASLDALVNAALIDYPIYVTPDGWPCEAEDLVEALIAARDRPLPPPPRGRVRRWWRGLMASLDRTPPPSY